MPRTTPAHQRQGDWLLGAECWKLAEEQESFGEVVGVVVEGGGVERAEFVRRNQG